MHDLYVTHYRIRRSSALHHNLDKWTDYGKRWRLASIDVSEMFELNGTPIQLFEEPSQLTFSWSEVKRLREQAIHFRPLEGSSGEKWVLKSNTSYARGLEAGYSLIVHRYRLDRATPNVGKILIKYGIEGASVCFLSGDTYYVAVQGNMHIKQTNPTAVRISESTFFEALHIFESEFPLESEE